MIEVLSMGFSWLQISFRFFLSLQPLPLLLPLCGLVSGQPQGGFSHPRSRELNLYHGPFKSHEERIPLGLSKCCVTVLRNLWLGKDIFR